MIDPGQYHPVMRLYRVFLGLAILIVIGWLIIVARQLIARPFGHPEWWPNLDFLITPVLLCGAGVACVAALRQGISRRFMGAGIITVGIILTPIVIVILLLSYLNVFSRYVPAEDAVRYFLEFRILRIAETFVITCGAWALYSIVARHRPRLHRFACGWRWVVYLPLAAHVAWHACAFIWDGPGQRGQLASIRNWTFYIFTAGWAATMMPLIALSLIGIIDRMRFQQRGRIQRGKSEVELHCPHCGTRQMVPAGESRCPRCGMEFEITITEPRCLCGYLLRDIAGDRCPECGRPRGHRVKGRLVEEAEPREA
jgi:hypothetical protein